MRSFHLRHIADVAHHIAIIGDRNQASHDSQQHDYAVSAKIYQCHLLFAHQVSRMGMFLQDPLDCIETLIKLRHLGTETQSDKVVTG